MFAQQEQAIQAQVPAVQQLFNNLVTGLDEQLRTETQNILESAGARGVLRSSLPVDLQIQLGQALLGERGRLEAQRAGQLADIQGRLGQLGIQRTTATSELARALQAADLQEREFELRRQQAERDFELRQREQAASRSRRSGISPTFSAATAASARARPRVVSNNAGGFTFLSAQNQPITAAQFAEQSGRDIRDVLFEIGRQGDRVAAQIYNQLAQIPSNTSQGRRILQQSIDFYKRSHPHIFGGV